MVITLPTQRQPATCTNSRFALFYGAPKIGKSFAASQLEGALHVDLEYGGADCTNSMRIRIDEGPQFVELLDTMLEARRAGGTRYRYAVYDTIDRVEEFAIALATQEYKASVLGKTFDGLSVLDLPKGGGYPHFWSKLKELLVKMMQSADHVLVLGHLRDKEIVDKTVQEVLTRDLDLWGKARNIVCSMVDTCGYMFVDRTGNLKVTFTPGRSGSSNEVVNAGTRPRHLCGKVIELGTMRDGVLVCDWTRIYVPEPGAQEGVT